MTKLVLLLSFLLAGCEADHLRCDPGQRYSHGLCFVLDPMVDAGADAGPDATPQGSADTPAAPRSGS